MSKQRSTSARRARGLAFPNSFTSASLVGGNFEGALGDPANCPAENKLCFAAPDSAAELMRQAGFSLVTAENNHSGDLGQAGRNETRAAFQQSGLLALDFDSSPQFFRFGELTVGFIAVTTIKAADGQVRAGSLCRAGAEAAAGSPVGEPGCGIDSLGQ